MAAGNDQKVTFYDFSTITPKIGLTASDYLLVRLDYFDPDFTVGQGFFSVDSYPVNDSIVSSSTITTLVIGFASG